jgi:hypothetical protein
MGLGRYGVVRKVQEENWSRANRYPVANGIKISVVSLVHHISSHVVITGYRTLIPYKGQPTTCYGYNGTRHLYQDCPRRRRMREADNANIMTLWADVAARGSGTVTPNAEDMEVGAVATEIAGSMAQICDDFSSTPPREEKPPSREGKTDGRGPTNMREQRGRH